MLKRAEIKGVLKRWSAKHKDAIIDLKDAQLRKARSGRVVGRWQKKLKDLDKPVVGPSIMYDSVTLSEIPRNAPAVAGYVGGRFLTFPKLAAQFPNARHVSIAVASTQDADVLDIEPGNSRPDLAPGWFRRQKARGLKRTPVLYSSLSDAKNVVSAMSRAGIPRNQYRLWTAHYTHKPHICGPSCGFGMPTTADATQWTDKALGRNLDQSLVRPSFWR